MTHTTSTTAEAVVIGAGPCGLFQVFQLGLQGIRCLVIEAAATPGGQCTELYADKPIYDIPGIPHLLAGQLSQQLLTQIKPFGASFCFNTMVQRVERTEEGEFILRTSNDDIIYSRFVIIATGAGAFTPVKMRIDGIDSFEESQLFYHRQPDTSDSKVTIVGDTQAAIDTAIQCAGNAVAVSYVHRKRRMAGSPQSLARLQSLVDSGEINILNGKATGINVQNKKIVDLIIAGRDKKEDTVPTDVLIARLGNSPKVQNFHEWNLDTERNLIKVNSASFQSNLDGLFAIGDISGYTGKRKLILCGFHEATLAAFAIAQKMRPGKPVHTQYTTTSTELLERLDVSPE